MKTKIVLWGSNEKDEKVLLGLELIEHENKVKIYVFDESDAKEDFYNLMMNDWRIGNPVIFPEGHQEIERPLSITEDLLPENIKVTRSDVINRAKTEWHFVVLSAKLYEIYKSEIAEFKDKISNLEVFDKNIWEELKSFWQKVQEQVFEKNLFREHAQELHDETNDLFNNLKELRKKLDQEFQKISKEKAVQFHETLEDIEKKISEGFGLQPLWNELKKIQTRFRDENLSKGDKNDIWNRIDAAFKAIKEKKYGSKQVGKKSPLERIDNRYIGLVAAIKKMENSIRRDRRDMDFEGTRVEETYGQLEQEIRKAKIKMVEERIASKEAKLNEMNTTKIMLEEKIAKEKDKQSKEVEAQKVKEAEEKIKEKIKKEIEESNKILEDKLGAPPVASVPVREVENEVEEEKEIEEEKETLSETLSDAAEDVIDTVKATAKVIGDRISKAASRLTEEEE